MLVGPLALGNWSHFVSLTLGDFVFFTPHKHSPLALVIILMSHMYFVLLVFVLCVFVLCFFCVWTFINCILIVSLCDCHTHSLKATWLDLVHWIVVLHYSTLADSITYWKTRKPSWRCQTRATKNPAKIATIRRVSFHLSEFHFPEFQSLGLGLYSYTQFDIWCLPIIKFLVQVTST